MTNLAQLSNLDTTKKRHIANLLTRLVETLDLSDSQYKCIQSAYNGVGNYLAGSDEPILRDAVVYSQGSVRLNTTVKPKNSEQYDVDLVCYLPNANGAGCWDVLESVRRRLDSHERYRDMLTPLPRGFRINYAGYHLDITPGVDYSQYPSEKNHPLWVTDVNSKWKESNPAGYASWFDLATERRPIYRLVAADSLKSFAAMESLQPLPDHTQKKLLNRIVQIFKRHRDVWAFEMGEEYVSFKPISVIITTLATHAYLKICNEQRVYDNDLDVILDVLNLMPNFILLEYGQYKVLNPAMIHENFAEKWNIIEARKGEKLRNCFRSWHQAAVYSFTNLGTVEGEDKLLESLSRSFGERPVKLVREAMVHRVNEARKSNKLSALAGTGALVTGTSAKATVSSHSIPSNTFYGSSAAESVTVSKNTFFGS